MKPAFLNVITWLGPLAAVLALGGCGGSPGASSTASGADASVASQTAPPAATALQVQVESTKNLRFDWPSVVGANSLALWVDPDGESGAQLPRELQPLAPNAQSHALSVFLPEALGARYRLRACNVAGCSDSAWVGVDDLNPAIGYLKASNAAAGDLSGWAIALSANGERVAIAALEEDGLVGGVNGIEDRGASNWNTGAVYVFQRGASGWRQEARLKHSHPDWGDTFGSDLDLSDDGRVLLVGAPNDDSPGSDPGAGGLGDAGAAFVFERDEAGQWRQAAYLKPPVSRAEAQFGLHVALSGNGAWAAVNARGVTTMSATMFRRTVAGWEFAASLPAGNNADDRFAGRRLSLDREGLTLAVGVATHSYPGHEVDPALPSGAVQVGAVEIFGRGANDQWSLAARLRPTVAAPRMSFGWATALSADGGRLVVGASPREWDVAFRGGAYVFDLLPGGWTQTAALLPSPGATSMRAGFAVDISGDGRSLVTTDVEEPGPGHGLEANAPAMPVGGAVDWYREQDDGQWQLARRLKAPNNQPYLYFGWGVALSADGQTLAAGALGESGAAGTDMNDRSASFAGAAYLY